MLSHVTRNIHGIKNNLNKFLRHKETLYSVQGTYLNECQVNTLRQEASAAGYALHFGNSVPLCKDANSARGRRTAILTSPSSKDISNVNDPHVTLLRESGR